MEQDRHEYHVAYVGADTPARRLLRLLGYAVLVLVTIVMVVPFIWMVSTSLKPPGSEFAWPPELFPREIYFGNYTELFTLLPFGQYFVNTAFITVATLVGQLIICSMAAYGFARLHFIGRDTIFIFYLATMMIPFQVTLIPLFLIVNNLGWVNTYVGLIVPGISSVFGIFLLRQSFLSVPEDYRDAARVEGANEFRIYAQIFMPLNGPALATLAVFSFMGTWTDLLWPLLIARDQPMRTLELGLAYYSLRPNAYVQPNWPLLMAGAVIVMTPVLIVYFFAQRYFIAGISLSGVKG
ncbi:MAG: carbohydrate ABC transporter permease [Anaerolineae bacterium]|nr:carbohydrate ABC transporter permease [Anaerolineae bacterium]